MVMMAGPQRLTRSPDVRRVLRRGRSRSGGLLGLHALPRPNPVGLSHVGSTGGAPEPGPARLTVVASRRVGGAVRRNRAKRLLREAARELRWRPELDVVLVARAACADATLGAVADELARLAAALDAVEGA